MKDYLIKNLAHPYESHKSIKRVYRPINRERIYFFSTSKKTPEVMKKISRGEMKNETFSVTYGKELILL